VNSALIDALIDVDGLGVIGLDNVENPGEVPDGGLIVVRRRGRGADRRAINGAQDRGNTKDYDDEHYSAPFRIHEPPLPIP
jgi:hypothetical protein